MNTFGRTFLILFLSTLAWVTLPACQKKCQQAGEIVESITATPWRLVESNNPEMKNNNKYSFIVMSFTQDFGGDIKKVVNNREFQDPVRVFRYNIESDGRSGFLRIAYSEVIQGENGAEPGEVTETTDYDYKLGRDFTMTETQTGFFYRFVPYEGIVGPDNACTF